MFDEQPDGDPHGECAAEIFRLQHALMSLDTRLRECFGQPITAEEAYDSFYQDIVSEALASTP